MNLVLTNTVHEFNNLVYSFIKTKKIDETKIDSIDSFICEIKKYKETIVRLKHERKELVKIFSGLNLIENFLAKSKGRLIMGIQKKENPKSAEDIYAFREDIVLLANTIDSYALKPVGDLSAKINAMSFNLRERLRANSLYPEIGEKINPKDKQTKEITKILIKEMGI
jgi:hypothetical protein